MSDTSEEIMRQLSTAVRALERVRLETKYEDGATVDELTDAIDLIDFVVYRALKRLQDSPGMEIQGMEIKL